MSLSDNIKKFRIKKGLTQEELASLLSVSAQAVSKWETSETYPDGAILVSLANILNVSLDTLFDNNNINLEEVSLKTVNLLSNAPKEKIFEIAYDICWAIELGLFNSLSQQAYKTNFINYTKETNSSSFIMSDFGFTVLNNDSSPFFALFSNSSLSLSNTLGNGENVYNIFKHLSSFDTIKAILYLYKKDDAFLFDSALLQKECDICNENIEQVMNDLTALKIVTQNDIDINGKSSILFCFDLSRKSHKLIALFLMAIEYGYQEYHILSAYKRQKAFLE